MIAQKWVWSTKSGRGPDLFFACIILISNFVPASFLVNLATMRAHLNLRHAQSLRTHGAIMWAERKSARLHFYEAQDWSEL
jgi:hypothetical protein